VRYGPKGRTEYSFDALQWTRYRRPFQLPSDVVAVYARCRPGGPIYSQKIREPGVIVDVLPGGKHFTIRFTEPLRGLPAIFFATNGVMFSRYDGSEQNIRPGTKEVLVYTDDEVGNRGPTRVFSVISPPPPP
jgi:hypothetical protein